MNGGTQEIKCSVDSCQYNSNASVCTLDSIRVGNNNAPSAHDKTQTECDSFKAE